MIKLLTNPKNTKDAPIVSPIRNNFRRLLKEKELTEGRDIPLTQMEREAGVSRITLLEWQRDKIRRFDSAVVVKLCKYFKCDLCDLLYLDPDEDEK